ncbi:phage tail protein [Thioclava sp. BHET1]|nr:phage tail protein [Thioclava sp. BHET1]
MEPFIGQIALFAFNRIPRGWMRCDGTLLAISQYDALFAVIGTTYGGNGSQTFALPDLRGRIPLHQGQGQGLRDYYIGEHGGAETVTLISSQAAPHRHALQAASANPPVDATSTPSEAVMLASSSNAPRYSAAPSDPAILAMQSIGFSGGSQPHDNMMPTVVMNYCIATMGLYPQHG